MAPPFSENQYRAYYNLNSLLSPGAPSWLHPGGISQISTHLPTC